jgi:hypothetical protein
LIFFRSRSLTACRGSFHLKATGLHLIHRSELSRETAARVIGGMLLNYYSQVVTQPDQTGTVTLLEFRHVLDIVQHLGQVLGE